MTSNDSLTAKAEALLKEITAGDWFLTEQKSDHDSYERQARIGARLNGAYVEHYIGLVYETPNAAFIAAAPQLVRDLLAQHARDQQEIEQVKKELLATRVDGERRAAGPTGSTAASNEVSPALLQACKVEAIRHMRDAVETYAEWCGGVHDDLCPEDDTCDCSVKWVNDGVNTTVRFLRGLEEGQR